MSADKHKPPDFGDVDWDAALDEWEKKSFVPEVAAEIVADASEKNTAPPPAGEDIETRFGPDDATRPGDARAPESLRDMQPDGTVIAPLPRELRADHVRVAGSRGGLGQLFAKDRNTQSPPPRSVVPPVRLPAPSSDKTRVAPASYDPWKSPGEETLDGDVRPMLALTGSGITQPGPRSREIPEEAFRPPSDPTVVALPSDQASDRASSLPTGETLVARQPVSATSPSAVPILRTDEYPIARIPTDQSLATNHDPLYSTEEPTQSRTLREFVAAAPAPPPVEREHPSTPPFVDFEAAGPTKWLDEKPTLEYRRRAAWFEDEARSPGLSPLERARLLLTVSELRAIVGDEEGARAAATEAGSIGGQVPLALVQARHLGARDPATLTAALDAESVEHTSPSARVHAALMAAHVLRKDGQGDLAVERWERATSLDPTDVRAFAARAAIALAEEDHAAASASLPKSAELGPFASALATVLRLRGVSVADAPPSLPINDALRVARTALEAGDPTGVVDAMAPLGDEPSIAIAANWLVASFGAIAPARRSAASTALRKLAGDGDSLAPRALAARGLELDDPTLVAEAVTGSNGQSFPVPERAALLALLGRDLTDVLEELAPHAEQRSLTDALSATTSPSDPEAIRRRARRAAGSEASRHLSHLGRTLAWNPSLEIANELLAEREHERSPAAVGVALESAIRQNRWSEVASALSTWGDELSNESDSAAEAQALVAAALVAERAKDTARARRAWQNVATRGAAETAVRALAALDPDDDVASELLRVADELPDGVHSATLRLEAIARRSAEPEPQLDILERVHRAMPEAGIAAFLAERAARRRGNVDEVVRWIHERKSHAGDPLEVALDAVREALLVADRDPAEASRRLSEAHAARPDDAALRELFERMSTEPPTDRAAWREKRANAATAPSKAIFLTEAALEAERVRDLDRALRLGRAALSEGSSALSRLLVERVELEVADTGPLLERLRSEAREAESDDVRIATFERLADLEHHGRKDPAKAIEWHRRILEAAPGHKRSLRYLEHQLVGSDKDVELAQVFESIAVLLDQTPGSECSAHAQLAARLQVKGENSWERAYAMIKLASTQPEPSLWSVRALNGHARSRKDDDAILSTSLALLERTQRSAERSALLVRAAEAARRLGDSERAREILERASVEDPGDVVTWGMLAELRMHSNDPRAVAEACESIARTSAVPNHQLLAWYDATRIWIDEVKEPDRAMTSLEQAAEIDVSHADIFARLSQTYAERHLDAELARLLEKRLERVDDEEERVVLQVDLARALTETGDFSRAKAALEGALTSRPNHTTALAAMADLSAKEGDWASAEQAYVRLARLLVAPEEQRAIYEKLGEIYSTHAVNFSRAEVAYNEVLKRAPDDAATLSKLVEIYKKQGDAPRAIEAQQRLVTEASDPEVRLARLVEVASIHETAGRDVRKAEQALEAARREFPTSVVALRAMAEFYQRHRQMPAMQILLDRAAGDARRAFGAGRFVTSLFEILHAAYDLRGKKDAARVVAATLAAVEGQSSDILGAQARAFDPRLDDLLAPEVISPALRELLARAGDALDAIAPFDLRAVRAAPMPPGAPLGTMIGSLAASIGLPGLQIFVAPQLGLVAIPLASNPPTLLLGEALLHVDDERARMFTLVRALKMVLARGSALVRGEPVDVAANVSSLFAAFNPSFQPPLVEPRRVADTAARISAALPKNLGPTVGVVALEAAGALGSQAPALAASAVAWGNRAALLAVGDPNAALDSIAWSKRLNQAPKGSEERAAWIARTTEARELMAFSVTDPYAEARTRLGLDR